MPYISAALERRHAISVASVASVLHCHCWREWVGSVLLPAQQNGTQGGQLVMVLSDQEEVIAHMLWGDTREAEVGKLP